MQAPNVGGSTHSETQVWTALKRRSVDSVPNPEIVDWGWYAVPDSVIPTAQRVWAHDERQRFAKVSTITGTDSDDLSVSIVVEIDGLNEAWNRMFNERLRHDFHSLIAEMNLMLRYVNWERERFVNLDRIGGKLERPIPLFDNRNDTTLDFFIQYALEKMNWTGKWPENFSVVSWDYPGTMKILYSPKKWVMATLKAIWDKLHVNIPR